MHFLCDIIVVRNCSGDNEPPWKMPLWIFNSSKDCLPAVNSSLQFSIALVMKFITGSDILNIFRYSIIHIYGIMSYVFFLYTIYSSLSSLSFLPSQLGGCRIHWLHLCRGGKTPPHHECPGYDTKQSDGEVPAVLEFWGMRSTPSLPSLPGPLWPGVVAPDKGPIYGLNRTNSILLLKWIE